MRSFRIAAGSHQPLGGGWVQGVQVGCHLLQRHQAAVGLLQAQQARQVCGVSLQYSRIAGWSGLVKVHEMCMWVVLQS